jgi:hypothetical protein
VEETKLNLDDILDSIKEDEKEIVTIGNEKEITTKKDLIDDDQFLEVILEMTLDDRKLADKYYDTFSDEVANGMDRSQASKEAMGKALELKINSAKNIIDAKKAVEKNKNPGGGVGIFFGGQGPKKAGIDVNNLIDE